MSVHTHKLVMVVRTWARFPNLELDDVAVVCADCTCDRLGLVAGIDEATGELEVLVWDVETYPCDADASAGDACYRPGPDFPPSLDEIAFRTGRVPS